MLIISWRGGYFGLIIRARNDGHIHAIPVCGTKMREKTVICQLVVIKTPEYRRRVCRITAGSISIFNLSKIETRKNERMVLCTVV